MRIGIQTWGSEGDIRPFLALAGGLRHAGHQVSLVITSAHDRDYHPLARRLGVRLSQVATPVIANARQLRNIGIAVVRERNPVRQFKIIMEGLYEPAAEPMYAAAQDLCRQHDVVIAHFLHYYARIAAEQAGLPVATVMLAHNALPAPRRAPQIWPDGGPWLNRLGWGLQRWVFNRYFLPDVNRARRRHGLAPARDLLRDVWTSTDLHLTAVSPALCPPQPSDPPHHHVCGFFAVPESDAPLPAQITDFLAQGPAPVYMTFGSLTPSTRRDRLETVKLLRAAAQRAGCRALIQVRETDLAMLEGDAQTAYCAAVSHAQVFPRCAAVVHHGGAGTSHSVARAGIPSVVVAHFAEQEFWGRELKRLGVAKHVLRRRDVSAEGLARGLRQVLHDPAVLRAAQVLGANMRDEDGVGRAVQAIEARWARSVAGPPHRAGAQHRRAGAE